MRYTKIIIFLAAILFLGGCQEETKLLYIYPRYQVFKIVSPIKSTTVTVEDDNRLSAKNTTAVFNLVAALRKKERYSDSIMRKHNTMAYRKNKEAEAYNKKHRKELDEILKKE